jgi:hypothetical protein
VKRRKKIALTLLVLVALSQIPFVYRHIRILRLSNRIDALSKERTVLENPRYKDLTGVVHVHTSLGGHSRATLEDLLEGSKGLDFVVITEHTANVIDSAALTLNGTHEGILFVGGNELDTLSDRLLLIPGTREAYLRRYTETPEFLPPFQKEGRLAFVTYPERFNSWNNSTYDGVEVFNLSSSARNVNKALFLFDMLWAYGSRLELTLATHLVRPDENLRKYDDAAKTRRLTLFAGSDAHSNIGIHVFGDETGHTLLNLKFDEYSRIFRIVRTHVLLERDKALTQETLLNALRQGHCYIGFDVLGESKGFSFTAGDKVQGDDVTLMDGLLLEVRVPVESRISILKNGQEVASMSGTTSLHFSPKDRGTYRVEVYQEMLGKPFDRMPWIISNPIYVK